MSGLTNAEIKMIDVPHDLEAERVLIGCVLLNNQMYADVAAELRTSDFFLVSHREIWDAIGGVLGRGIALDFITLAEQLRAQDRLEKVGGVSAISRLTDGIPRFSNLEEYVRIVKGKSISRQLLNTGAVISSLGYDLSRTPEEQLDEAHRQLVAISAGDNGKLVTAGEVGFRTIQDLEDFLASERAYTGIATGLTDLDFAMGGMQRGDLIIDAARPSMGKTALALRMTQGVAESRHNEDPVQIFFSTEMSEDSLIRRLQFGVGGVDSAKIRAKRLDREDWRKILAAQERIANWKLVIDDKARTTMEMRRAIRRAVREYGKIDVIYQDHIGLVNGKPAPHENRNREVGRITWEMKEIAKEFNAPFVALCQLSRANQARPDKRPSISDLRDSGEIEQNADVVLFPHREGYYNKEASPSDAEIGIGKQRNGPTPRIELCWLTASAWYENLYKKDAF